MPAEEWPLFPGVDADALTYSLNEAVRELDREDIIDLCIAYVRAYPWVHSVVIGAEGTDQLMRNLEYVNRTPLTVEQRKYVESTISAGPDYLVNPSRWSEVISAN